MSAKICPKCNTAARRQSATLCFQCGELFPLLNGKFVREREIGRGGMGVVYRARENMGSKLKENICAIKALPPQAGSNQHELAMKEAEMLQDLKARFPLIPIPKISYLFDEDDIYFIVTEWVEGENLEQRLRQHGRLPERQVIQYALKILGALEKFAECRPPLVHRDIKPLNILVNQDDEIYLIDFGIARAVPVVVANEEGSAGWGTDGFAAPELYEGKTREPKSDVYSLAATVYYLLSGDTPRGKNFQFARHQNISNGLWDALSHAHAYEIERRYTAKQFREALERISGVKRAGLYKFKDGTSITNVEQLIEYADSDWAKATRLFQDKEFAICLAELGETELRQQAEARREEKQVEYVEERLELFIEDLCAKGYPRARPPALKFSSSSEWFNHPPAFNLGEQHNDSSAELVFENQGGGYLFGKFHVEYESKTRADWLKVESDWQFPKYFEVRSGQQLYSFTEGKFYRGRQRVQLKIQVKDLPLETDQRAWIVFNLRDGQDIRIPLTVTRVNAATFFERAIIDFQDDKLDRALANLQELASRNLLSDVLPQADVLKAILLLKQGEESAWRAFVEARKLSLADVQVCGDLFRQRNLPLQDIVSYCSDYAELLIKRPFAQKPLTLEQIDEIQNWQLLALEYDRGVGSARALPLAIAKTCLLRAKYHSERSDWDAAFQSFQDAKKASQSGTLNWHTAERAALAQDFVNFAHTRILSAQAAIRTSEFESARNLLGQAQARLQQASQIEPTAVSWMDWARLAEARAWNEYDAGDLEEAYQNIEFAARNLKPGQGTSILILKGEIENARSGIPVIGKQMRQLVIIGVVVGGFAVVGILASLLIRLPDFFPLLLLAISALAFGGAALAMLFWQQARRVAHTQKGGQDFVFGLGSSAVIWMGLLLALMLLGGIVIGRLTISLPAVRWIALVGLPLVVGLALWTGCSMIEKEKKIQEPIALLTIRLSVSTVIGALVGAIVGGALLSFLRVEWVLELALVGALLGAVIGIGIVLFGQGLDQLDPGRSRIFVWFFIVVGIVFGLLFHSASSTILGFVLGVGIAAVCSGVALFAASFLNGQGQPTRRWERMWNGDKFIGIVATILALIVVLGGEAWAHPFAKTRQYEQGTEALAMGQTREARSIFRDLYALDPQFEDVELLARDVQIIFTKTADRTQALPGDIITFVLTIENRGRDPAQFLELQDRVPQELLVLPNTLTTGLGFQNTAPNTELIWRGQLEPRQKMTLSYQTRLEADGTTQASSDLSNAASLKYGSGQILDRHVSIRVLPTLTPTITPTPSRTPSPSLTFTPSPTPTRTRTARPTSTPEPTPTPLPSPPPLVLTIASGSWSGEQGKDGWWYEEGDVGQWNNWQEMNWDGELAYPNCNGGCWRSNSAPGFVRLDQFGGHPGPSRYVAKRWVSESARKVQIQLKAYKIDRGGDGVNLLVVENGNVIESRKLGANQTAANAIILEMERELPEKGWLMFVLAPNNDTYYDHTFMDITIAQITSP